MDKNLRIRRGLAFAVSTFAEASEAYCEARDASGEGYHTFPEGLLALDGETYRVSYNGRIWNGAKEWESGDKPVFP
jgi:hypothetical protein